MFAFANRAVLAFTCEQTEEKAILRCSVEGLAGLDPGTRTTFPVLLARCGFQCSPRNDSNLRKGLLATAIDLLSSKWFQYLLTVHFFQLALLSLLKD